MTDQNATALTAEQQQRAEAAVKAKEILYRPGLGASRIYSWEVIELTQFILTGEIPLDVTDEDDEEKKTS